MLARKLGTGPVKLLFDKSLQLHAENTNDWLTCVKIYHSWFNYSTLGDTYSSCNCVRFCKARAMLPVNPLSDKFLIIKAQKHFRNIWIQ